MICTLSVYSGGGQLIGQDEDGAQADRGRFSHHHRPPDESLRLIKWFTKLKAKVQPKGVRDPLE